MLRAIWTEDEEHRSNTEVEQPAAPGLRHLTESLHPRLSGDERQAVADYMTSLFRRGWRELTALPGRLRPVAAQLRASIHAAGFSPEALQALEENVADMSKHPLASPFPIRQVSDVVAAMRWTVLRCPDPMFVTGDSPVQIVPHVIVDPECEVTLPLSPTRALICDWGFPRRYIAIRVATGAEVVEVNRRTALGAEQYVYFADRPAEDAVCDLLVGEWRPRFLDVNGRRVVPPKHCREMERAVRRILRGRKKEDSQLIERLRAFEASSGLVG